MIDNHVYWDFKAALQKCDKNQMWTDFKIVLDCINLNIYIYVLLLKCANTYFIC